MYDKINRKVIRMNRSQPPKPPVANKAVAAHFLEQQGQSVEKRKVQHGKIKKENLYL